MTEVQPTTTATTTSSVTRSRIVLPLWIAAISLAVIAVVLAIASVQLLQAVESTQASVVQLQQQVKELGSGLGGILGG